MHESKYPQFQISTTIRKHSLYKFHISTVIYPVVHPSIVKITIYIPELFVYLVLVYSLKSSITRLGKESEETNENGGDIMGFPLWEIRDSKIKKDEESWNERKRLLVRAHPPLFKALKRVAARKMFSAEKEMEKGGSFGRDTVYMQMLNTRAVSTANFPRISTSHGVCVRALSRISFSDFSSCDVGGNVDGEKGRKERRRKEKRKKEASDRFFPVVGL